MISITKYEQRMLVPQCKCGAYGGLDEEEDDKNVHVVHSTGRAQPRAHHIVRRHQQDGVHRDNQHEKDKQQKQFVIPDAHTVVHPWA